MAFQSLILFSLVLIHSLLPAHAKDCSGYKFPDNKVFSSCTNLPYLEASLYYTHPSSSNTVSIAFKAPQSSTGWIAWGLNLRGPGMVGTQAIVAFFHSNGSLIAYPTQISSYAPSMEPSTLSFPVSNISFCTTFHKFILLVATTSNRLELLISSENCQYPLSLKDREVVVRPLRPPTCDVLTDCHFTK